ncbi:MAG: leucyl aminopeptidase [Verrucomicrobiota bacterium JB023]|nr:leucyl aminopeptidase [Verrucomicrobiota bacterium JB023]
MDVTFTNTLPSSGHLLVPFFDETSDLPAAFSSQLGEGARAQLQAVLTKSKLLGQKGNHLTTVSPEGLTDVSVTLWNAGSKSDFDAEVFGAEVMAAFRTREESELAFHLINAALPAEDVARVAVGARLAAYRFDKHRSKPQPKNETRVTSLTLIVNETEPALASYQNYYGPVCDGHLQARDLINEPANVLFPKAYAERIKALEECGLEVEVLDEKKMAALKMNALLGVGQGSARESQLVIMKWMGGGKEEAPVCFVGKGITFDSGGISLKPSNGMWNMKGDMGGSAAVVGAMQALALRKAKANVIGIVALAENMPDGNAQNPGDVITSMSGQTIELQSTDAEGRLVLADALWYAKETFQPKAMVDLATLTGAKLVALGSEHAALFTNQDELAQEFASSSSKCAERTWRLPLLPEYDRMLDSETADMKNSVAGGAGSITAAQFLQRFVGEIPWVHLDIAGSATKLDRKDPREPSFAVGFGVRLLNQWVADYYES